MPADNPEVARVLGLLLIGDIEPASMTDPELVKTLEVLRDPRVLIGKTAAELYRRGGWSWSRIGTVLGRDQSTIYRWAKPYVDPAEVPPS